MSYRVLFSCMLLLAGIACAAQGGMTAGRGRVDQAFPASLAGQVRTLDDHPIPDARVELRDRTTGLMIVSTYTLPNGSFEFTNLPRASYVIVATIGTQEARQTVDLAASEGNLVLRINSHEASAANGHSTVSVAQLKVPDKARKALQKAEEAFHKHKLDQAEQQIEKALQIFPRYSQALTLRGILDLGQNQAEKARASLEEAVQDDANYGMAYIALGATYNALSRFDDALRTLQRGLSLSPNSWQAYFETSKALLAKGQYEQSLRQVNKAGELCPASYASIHLVRAHALLGLKSYAQAITELEQYLGGEPNGPNSQQARQTLDQVRAFTATTAQK